MKVHLAELVDAILSQLEENPDVSPSEKHLRSWLTGQGYAKTDIDAALRVVMPALAQVSLPQHRTPGNVRHLSPFESSKMTPEARAALARLELYELIDPNERELLLERIAQSDGEVDLDYLDYLLSWLMGATRDVETQQTIFSVFEGSEDVIH